MATVQPAASDPAPPPPPETEEQPAAAGGEEIAALDEQLAVADGGGDDGKAAAAAEGGGGGGKLVAETMRKYAAPRSSRYHGVTRFWELSLRNPSSLNFFSVFWLDWVWNFWIGCRLKWSGKFEAHLWDNSSQVEGRKRKGKHGM